MEQRSKQSPIHWISSDESLEFAYFTWSLTHSSIIALDAEWKPFRTRQSSFPTVSLLQIACRIANCDSDSGSPVFLLDLSSLHLPSIYQILKDSLISPNLLKLGFGFKHDLMYLSSTFCSKGCDPGFDRVEPYIDAMSLYNYLQLKQSVEEKVSKQSKSLASICKELLGIQLSKELQCSDWSQRPLSQEQKEYAAADAQCLLEIFDVFKGRIQEEGQPPIEAIDSEMLLGNNTQMDVQLEHVIRKYGDMILLKDSDRKPKVYKQKEKKQKAKKRDAGKTHKQRQLASTDDWKGPPPWDLSLGGDECPKFLCDVTVEGLARHLRCVGIDAAIPHPKKPETRVLIEHADKEKRVILTRDAKLSKHGYLIRNQIYRVNNLSKNEQLVEVIETFQLKITEDQLMSRCIKCNGRFIQKPLTTEEALEATKGFQVPNCLFEKNLEFWKCMDCSQLYWEFDTTKKVWNYLERLHVRPNFAVQYQLEFKIRAIAQNDRSIHELYSEITALWDQLAMTESAALRVFAPYISRREEQRLVQLLMALQPEYETCRASILHRTPLPSVDSVIHELLVEETHLKTQLDKCVSTPSAHVLAAPSQQNRVHVKSGRECHYCKQTGHWKNQCLNYWLGKPQQSPQSQSWRQVGLGN